MAFGGRGKELVSEWAGEVISAGLQEALLGTSQWEECAGCRQERVGRALAPQLLVFTKASLSRGALCSQRKQPVTPQCLGVEVMITVPLHQGAGGTGDRHSFFIDEETEAQSREVFTSILYNHGCLDMTWVAYFPPQGVFCADRQGTSFCHLPDSRGPRGGRWHQFWS